MATAQRARRPLRYNTRLRRQPIVSAAPVSLGGRINTEVPRVGFLAGFLVQFVGGLNVAAGPLVAFSDRLFDFLNNLKVNMNLGMGDVVDMTGYLLYFQNHTLKTHYSPDLGGSSGGVFPNGSLLQDPFIFDADPTPAAGNTPLVLTWFVPVAANMGRNFNVGLVNVQATEVRCTIELSVGQVADLFVSAPNAGTAITAGSGWNVDYLFWEVPNPDLVGFPPAFLHRLISQRAPFANVGDITLESPHQGTTLRWGFNVIINNRNNSNAVEDITLRLNRTDRLIEDRSQANRVYARMNQGHSLPIGALLFDFWSAEDVMGSGDFRDALDTEAVATVEAIIGIRSGTVLGVGNNFIDSYREIVQVLQG